MGLVATSTPTAMLMYNVPTFTSTPLPTAAPGAIPDVLREQMVIYVDASRQSNNGFNDWDRAWVR